MLIYKFIISILLTSSHYFFNGDYKCSRSTRDAIVWRNSRDNQGVNIHIDYQDTAGYISFNSDTIQLYNCRVGYNKDKYEFDGVYKDNNIIVTLDYDGTELDKVRVLKESGYQTGIFYIIQESSL
jgi:hypothetical protein